jgi:hypothetical protein
MVKLPYGHKLCKISNSPYQGFRWKAGPSGRFKETIISSAVAKDRNICQTCLNDMKYGLPVGLRDSLLRNEQSSAIAMPQSEVGTKYFFEQQAALVEAGGGAPANFSQDVMNMPASRQLDKFSLAMRAVEARNKTAFRNLPKMCSFWLNGACNRVGRKTCPFRPCCGAFAFPEIAGSHRELCKDLIAELELKGPAEVMKTLAGSEVRQALHEALKGNRDDAIRRRVSGEDDLSRKYLGKMKAMVR